MYLISFSCCRVYTHTRTHTNWFLCIFAHVIECRGETLCSVLFLCHWYLLLIQIFLILLHFFIFFFNYICLSQLLTIFFISFHYFYFTFCFCFLLAFSSLYCFLGNNPKLFSSTYSSLCLYLTDEPFPDNSFRVFNMSCQCTLSTSCLPYFKNKTNMFILSFLSRPSLPLRNTWLVWRRQVRFPTSWRKQNMNQGTHRQTATLWKTVLFWGQQRKTENSD